MTRLLALTALAVAFGVSAQSLSQQCTSALTTIAISPASACLSPSSLIPLVSGASGGNTSIVGPIDTWLTNVCGTAACSNDSLAAIVTNLTSGCSTELSGLGFSSGDTSTIISTVQQFYPIVRQIACLKDGNTNCIAETLTNIQNIDGNLTITNIAGLISQGNASFPSNVTCTNCVKAAYNTVNTAFPSLLSSENSTLQEQCGSSFLDGSAPSGIVESASNSSSTSSGSNGALGAISEGPLLSLLLILGSGFTLL